MAKCNQLTPVPFEGLNQPSWLEAYYNIVILTCLLILLTENKLHRFLPVYDRATCSVEDVNQSKKVVK